MSPHEFKLVVRVYAFHRMMGAYCLMAEKHYGPGS